MTTEAYPAAPTLNHLFPAGGQRGSKVVVTCSGTFTPWPTKIWSPGVESTATGESGKIEISIPADLATDRVWIRLYNDEGASVLQPFLIGSLDELIEAEPNDRPKQANPIDNADITMNGVLKDKDVDCFAVKLDQRQTLVAAVDANTRLGSPMDAVVQISNEDGVVLAENHDDLKLDPRLAFTAPRKGTYVVRLFAFPAAPDASIRFTGANNYIYRLTLTTGPYVTHAIPLSAPIDNPRTVSVAGWNLPNNTLLNVVPLGAGKLADLLEHEVRDELQRASDAQIGFANSPDFKLATRVRLTNQAVVRGFEKSDPKQPIDVQSSTSVTGCLKSPKQVDDYKIPLMKGQQVLMSVEARSLDLSIDPLIKLDGPKGNVVAEADDTGPSRDALIAYSAAEDGEHRLSVRDRYSHGGDRSWYLLTVRNDTADFHLSLAADTVTVAPDKPTEVVVKIQRTGKSAEPIGPITIDAVGLPDAVKTTAVISEPSGPTSTEVKLTFTSTGGAFNGPIRIVGKISAPMETQRFARVPARLGVAFDTVWLTATEKK